MPHSPSHFRRFSLAVCAACLGAGIANAAAAADSSVKDAALQAQAERCKSRLKSLEQKMIERLNTVEQVFGERMRQRPELELMRAQAKHKLDAERERYAQLPWRREHDLGLRALSNEISTLDRAIAIARDAERTISEIRPFLSQARERGHLLGEQLDEFAFRRQQCAGQTFATAECHARELAPAYPPLHRALQAARGVLEQGWSPLNNREVRYPSTWENDCDIPS